MTSSDGQSVRYNGGAPSVIVREEVIGPSFPSDQVELSIVVPTFNEEHSIEETIDGIYSNCPLNPDQVEVIVADESTDSTPDVVRGMGHDNLRLLRFDEDLGLAKSVIEGFRHSRGKYVGVIDADGQHPSGKLFELFKTAREGEHDVVVASRYVDDGGIDRWSLYRRLVSYGATYIAKLFLLPRAGVSDPMSGFFVIRRSVLEGVTLAPVGYKILLDILVRVDGLDVEEVGYVFSERSHGTSKLDAREYVRFLVHVSKLAAFKFSRALTRKGPATDR